MQLLLKLPTYFYWHYTRALAQLLRIIKTNVWFIWHLFSFSVLAKTLFSPWQRIQETSTKGAGLEGWASAIIVNLIMRLVGLVIRLMFLIMGTIALLLALGFSIVVIIGWILLPVIIVYAVVDGLIIISKNI